MKRQELTVEDLIAMPLRIKLLLTKCDTAWEGLGAYLAFIQEPERLSSVKEKAELPHTLAEPSSSPTLPKTHFLQNKIQSFNGPA